MARRTPSPHPTHVCHLAVQRTTCATCGIPLHVAHHTRRTIRRLDGIWRLTMPLMRCQSMLCPRFHRLGRPEEQGAWAWPHGEFGFDVIALVGQLRYGQLRSIPKIHQELRVRGVVIAERTVQHWQATKTFTEVKRRRKRRRENGKGHHQKTTGSEQNE